MMTLLTAIKKHKNGETVGLMAERGLNYPVNYGVGAPTVKLLARNFAPDHELAKLLYVQGVRELKLASFVAADPDMIAGELGFWAEGLRNSELAEHFAAGLLSHSAALETALAKWLGEDAGKYLQYAALIALCKAIDAGRKPLSVEKMRALAERFSASGEAILQRAADNLAIRLD